MSSSITAPSWNTRPACVISVRVRGGRPHRRGRAMPPDLLQRKQTHFVLWIPRTGVAPPTLVIGELQYGAPPSLAGEARHALQPAPGAADLWHIPASSCGLAAGKVYRYWYEVDETDPGGQPGSRIPICDPTAVATDWRLTKGDQPAAIVKFENGNLVACDGGGEAVQSAVPVPGPLATN